MTILRKTARHGDTVTRRHGEISVSKSLGVEVSG